MGVLDMEELGMEAVWKIEVKDFPAFMVVDDKGNDFFKMWSGEADMPEVDSFFDESKDFFFGLDADQSGMLDTQELAKGLDITEEQAEELVKTFDRDDNGLIDLKEFEIMLLKRRDLLIQL